MNNQTAAPNYQKVHPTTDRVLVEPIKPPEMKGGLYVPPDTTGPTRGIVVAIGPGRITNDGVRILMSVKIGDEVVFSSYSGSKLKIDGKDVCMIHEDEIFCTVDKDE